MTVLRRSPLTLRALTRRPYHTTPARAAKLTTRHASGSTAVHELVTKDGVDVLIQPCECRVFAVDDFLKAGTKLHPTLQRVYVLVGIKETPLLEVLTDPLPAPGAHVHDAKYPALVPRTQVMFSHTVKGQLYNMELLSKCLTSKTGGAPSRGALSPRLIGYELPTGDDGKRTVGFDWFAGAYLPPVTIMAVDILPTAPPLEASQHFSTALLPYLRTVLAGYTHPNAKPTSTQIHEALCRATVAQGGELTPSFEWLRRPLGIWKENIAAPSSEDDEPAKAGHASKKPLPGAPRKKRVLMLGSGMVARPAVDELCRRSDVELVIASDSIGNAERLAAQHPNAQPVKVDVSDRDSVGRLVQGVDVVISLLPVPFHTGVAEACIEYRKYLVTASYISPAMQALHQRAVDVDVVLMNEIGLDPGIDHCSALSLLEKLRSEGKEIVSFTSFCGGLPTPEHADVPLSYRFSWSPKDVLSAALNPVRFKLWGGECAIDGDALSSRHFPSVPLSNVPQFEGIAGRKGARCGTCPDT
ncbi:Saccharopine dehydrogenase-domain-containing protein [Trametes maxima]|nr:Saccharopine dehydrogenase-domain-containing protein [Trametes maxima]